MRTSPGKGLRRAAIRIAALLNVIGTGVILVLIAVMNADIVARGVFHAPFRGVAEIVVFSLVLIVFLQLPDVVEGNRLTRSDGFLRLLGGTRPVAARLLRRAVDLVAAMFFAMLVWAVWPSFLESFESCHFFSQPEFGPQPSGNPVTDLRAAFGRCHYFGTPGILTAPWWPAKLAILIGVALSSALFLYKALCGDKETENQS